MNLAIDLFIKTAQMLPSEVNRTDEAVYMPNGKGVNVSFILKELGIDSTATGFKAGFTGQFIEEELQKAGIQTQFVTVDGITRINVFTQVVDTNEEFKLVNQGPSVTPKQEASLLAIVENMNADDILFVSGSHPEGHHACHLRENRKSIPKNVALSLFSTLPLILYRNYWVTNHISSKTKRRRISRMVLD